MPEWWENGENVLGLARWLDARDWFNDNTENVIDYFAAPYKFGHEWEHMKNTEDAEPVPIRQKNCDFCAEIDEPEEETDD